MPKELPPGGRPTFVKDDAGRTAAGRRPARDCVTRAFALAFGRPYMDVYRELNAAQRAWGQSRGLSKYHQSARNGIAASVHDGYLRDRGWTYTKCTSPSKLPRTGVHVLDMPGHFAVLDDWQLRDTWDSLSFRTQRGRLRLRILDGYWSPPAAVVESAGGQLALFAA